MTRSRLGRWVFNACVLLLAAVVMLVVLVYLFAPTFFYLKQLFS